MAVSRRPLEGCPLTCSYRSRSRIGKKASTDAATNNGGDRNSEPTVGISSAPTADGTPRADCSSAGELALHRLSGGGRAISAKG